MCVKMPGDVLMWAILTSVSANQDTQAATARKQSMSASQTLVATELHARTIRAHMSV